MAIYLRGKTWWYDITVKGKQQRGSCRTRDRQQAQEYHDRLRAEAWRGKVLGDKPRRTIAEAFERHLAESALRKSLREFERFKEWWQEKLEVGFLDEIDPDVIAGVVDEHCEEEAAATTNRRLSFLRTVVRKAALEWGWLEKAPKVKLLEGEVERFRFLEPHEIERLLGVLPAPYNLAAKLAVATGLRQSNIFKLRWDQVSLVRRTAVFPKQVMKNGRPFSIPLNATAVEVIRGQIGKHTEFVFCRTDGEPINGLPSKLWKKAVSEAKLEDLRWHDLRHTWASLLRQAGVGLDDLQELGGWKSRTMVLRYAHLYVEHLAGHAAVMDGVLRGNNTSHSSHRALAG